MGKVHKHPPVKLMVGLISNNEELLPAALKRLQKQFGMIDFQSQVMPFNFTAYYQAEMGPNLRRQFVSFQRLIQPQNIARIKLITNRIEQGLSASGKRRINIDPGYLTAAKVVLVSTKDYYHRIYLEKGIFAEITLAYADNAFRPLEWTYPDYQSEEYLHIFKAIRTIFLRQLKQNQCGNG